MFEVRSKACSNLERLGVAGAGISASTNQLLREDSGKIVEDVRSAAGGGAKIVDLCPHSFKPTAQRQLRTLLGQYKVLHRAKFQD
jgi:hypothetical protein